MPGYWNDPEKTAEAFRNGWFHSGDLGVMDDEGYLTVVDRKKDMIKTGGENVASREVEEALYRASRRRRGGRVRGPRPKWIEAVTAAVVLRDGVHRDRRGELIAYCPQRLAGFKAPKHVGDRRRAAQEPQRQDPQARSAHDVRVAVGELVLTRC